MRRSVLLALAAAALVAAPQAWADEQHSDQGHESHEQRGGQHPAQGQHPGGPQGQPQGQHGWGGQPHGQGQAQGQSQGQYQHGWGAQPQGRPQGQPQGQIQGQRSWNGPRGQAQGGWNARPGGAVEPGQRGPQAGRWNGQGEQRFDRRANPGGWGQTRNAWRGAHSGWDRSVPWRQNHDWWRGRPEFRGFTGPRVGFWFIPGFGYHQVPREYWGRHWAYGDYLPRFFWQYEVDDWAAYDLPPPPWGTAWVWIDGGVALVDLSDGYILDVEYGLW